jgi:hypothetical protein
MACSTSNYSWSKSLDTWLLGGGTEASTKPFNPILTGDLHHHIRSLSNTGCDYLHKGLSCGLADLETGNSRHLAAFSPGIPLVSGAAEAPFGHS